MTITPVLLCGGSGTRLWPLSRKSYPKQFTQLVGEESLFQASARRLSGVGYGAPLVITGSDFRFIVTEQLAETGIENGTVLIEPEGRNTPSQPERHFAFLPADLSSSHALQRRNAKPMLLCLVPCP